MITRYVLVRILRIGGTMEKDTAIGSQILKEAFHLNFDDVGKDIEGFWLN